MHLRLFDLRERPSDPVLRVLDGSEDLAEFGRLYHSSRTGYQFIQFLQPMSGSKVERERETKR
jgi:hypothetical protein